MRRGNKRDEKKRDKKTISAKLPLDNNSPYPYNTLVLAQNKRKLYLVGEWKDAKIIESRLSRDPTRRNTGDE